MNNDVLPVFTDIHKYLSLIMSDRVSSMLKLNFDMKDVNCNFEEYREFTADVNQFSYIGLFKFKNRGLLLFFDSKIIYVLCNRMLGGHGLAETKPKPVFTFSENFFAEKMLTMFFDFFKDTKLNVSFLRSEKNLDLIHFFYPDEKILSVKMNCKINSKPAGRICACYPQLIMDKKESPWGV